MIVQSADARLKTAKTARRKSRSLLLQITERRRRAKMATAPLVADYLRNYRVKVWAADRSYRHLGLQRMPALSSVASQINLYARPTEDVTFFLKDKSSGGKRAVFCFGPIATARQIMMLDLLKALYDRPSWQYDQRGKGRDCALEGILSAILGGLTHFGSLDISDCFQSFDSDRIVEILSLPEDVVRNNITALDIRSLSGSNIPRVAFIHTHLQSLPLGGLPQGSMTSNYVSGILLSDLTDLLPPSVEIFMYGDDIVVLADTKAKIIAATSALRDGLRNHRSGCLRLKRCVYGNVHENALTFLGYKIAVDRDKVEISLSDSNEYKLSAKWCHFVQEDIANVDENVTASSQFLDNFLSGFRLVPQRPIRDAFGTQARELVRLERQIHGVPQIAYTPSRRRRRGRRKPKLILPA